MSYTIESFCKKHDACSEGKEWALKNCPSNSMEEAWEKLPNDYLIWVATRPGVLSDKELRLFAVYCARSVERLLTDKRSINAINVAENFANGEATKEELEAAGAAGWDAARDAGWAAGDAAGDAARAAAGAARWAAGAAGWAAGDAARDAQVAWLRKNTTPNFTETGE